MTHPPRIAILGLPYFGSMLAEKLRARGWRATFFPHPGRNPARWAKLAPALLRADVVYLIGSRIERGSPQDRFMRLRRGVTAIHWVGTDVLIAAEEQARGRVSERIARRAIHWCDAPWLVDELRQIGVAATHLPLPIPGAAAAESPLPPDFRVLLYLPVDPFDREVFDMETLPRLPAALPDVQFTLIPSPADTLPGPLPPNLEARGWVQDMEPVYAAHSVLVRLTSHDGMSFMVVEALARGRYAIWTWPLEGAVRAQGFDEVIAALRNLADRHADGSLRPNHEGAEFVRGAFEPQAAITRLEAALRTLLRN